MRTGGFCRYDLADSLTCVKHSRRIILMFEELLEWLSLLNMLFKLLGSGAPLGFMLS